MKKIFICLALLAQCFISHTQTYSVGVQSVTWTDASRSNRSVPVEFHYPGTNTAIATDTFGFVVFGHGFDMTIDAYYNYADSLASHGYIVALTSNEGGLSPSHPNLAQDLIYIYNMMISESKNNSSSPLYHHVKSRGAIAGHSMGGGCAVLSCQYSDTATCYWTLAEATTTPSSITAAPFMLKPYLSFAGSSDCIAPATTNQIPTYDSSGSICKTLIEIKNATHCQFANSNVACNFGEGVSGCASTPLSRAAQTNDVLYFLYPYLDYYLNGNCSAWTLFQSRYNADATDVLMQSCNNVVPANQAITGDSTFCSGSSDVLTANPSGFLYSWSNSATTSSISVSNTGSYTATVSNGTCAVTTAPFAVTEKYPPAAPSSITGPDTVCANSTGIHISVTNDLSATSYNWTVPSGWNITAGAGTNAITVSSGSAGGTISVTAQNSCGAGSASQKTFTVISSGLATPGAVSGDSVPCAGQTVLYSITPVSGASSYTWTYPSGWTIVSGSTANTLNITAGNTGGNVAVQAVNACGSSSASSLNVNVRPFTTGQAITGATYFCSGGTDVLTANPAGFTYHWSDNSTGSTITVSSAGAYSLTVSNGACSATAAPFVVTESFAPATPGALSVADTVCAGIANIIISVPNDTTASVYNWALPSGWQITSGNNTHAITVVSGTVGGNISVTAQNGCGTSAPVQKSVVVVPSNLGLPGAITGDTIACQGQSVQYLVAAVSGANSYFWSYPQGWILNSTNTGDTLLLTVGSNSGNITVEPVNGCGQGYSSSLHVISKTIPAAGNIIGADTICINATSPLSYTLAGSTGADSVFWTAPNSWNIISGQGTANLIVNDNHVSGIINATAKNVCGTTNAAPLAVQVVDTPTAVIMQSHDTLTATAGVSYQWYLNGNIIAGANAQNYIATQNGNYMVTIANAANCSGSSAALNFVAVGIADITAENAITVFPNPSNNGHFQLTVTAQWIGGHVSVFDALGRQVWQSRIAEMNAQMDITNLSKGVYFATFELNGTMVNKKLVIE